MAEYIERAGIIGKITASEVQKAVREMDGNQVYSWFLMLLNAEPAAEVTPAVHGEWVINGQGNPCCSRCRSVPTLLIKSNFCANCGSYNGGKDNGKL